MKHAVIRISAPLRRYTDGNAIVTASGDNVGEILASLFGTYEALHDQIADGQGDLRPEVLVLVGETDVRGLDGLGTVIQEGDVVEIVPVMVQEQLGT